MMIKPWSCCTILVFAIVSFGHILFLTHAEKISDYRLCGDRSCQTLLSKARTLARHKPTDPTFLPFERGAMIDIYSKSAGSRQDLWGGELNGRRGYFPRSFVREYKVEYQNPQHVVETEHHVPIEDRVRGVPERKQVPPSARTVHPDGTNQQQTHEDKKEDTSEDLSQNKKESDEEKKQETTDAVDETEIGDETELADEEQEVVETVSVFIDDTNPPSNMKTDSTAAETQEQQQPADVESKDSTEVDETEIDDDDETETAETEDGEETSKTDDRIEPGMTEDEKEIEKIADETETSKTEDETEIGETEIEEKEEEAATGKTNDAEKQGVEKQADGSIDTDRLAGDTSTEISEENVDKMEQMQTADRDALTSREKEETNDAKTDETDKGDGEGTMFGNIWSDESEGKVSESEVIDINYISHGDHADFNPYPDINTGDHRDSFIKENTDVEGSILHVQKNDGNVKSLRKDDSFMHGDDTDMKSKTDTDDNVNTFNRLKSDDQNLDKEEYKVHDSDSKHSKTYDQNGTADSFMSKHVGLDLVEKLSTVESAKESLENEQHDSENIVNDIHAENGNIHLKDILKSSLPDGNDVHKYIVEHSAADSEFSSSERIESDMHHDSELEKNQDYVLKHTETQGADRVMFDTALDDTALDDTRRSSSTGEKDQQGLKTDDLVEAQEKSLSSENLNLGTSGVAYGNEREASVEDKQNVDFATNDEQEKLKVTPSRDLSKKTEMKQDYKLPEREKEEIDMTVKQKITDRDTEDITYYDNSNAETNIKEQIIKGTSIKELQGATSVVDNDILVGDVDIHDPSVSSSKPMSLQESENSDKTRFDIEERTHETVASTFESKRQEVKGPSDMLESSTDTRINDQKSAKETGYDHIKNEDKPLNLINKTDDLDSIHVNDDEFDDKAVTLNDTDLEEANDGNKSKSDASSIKRHMQKEHITSPKHTEGEVEDVYVKNEVGKHPVEQNEGEKQVNETDEVHEETEKLKPDFQVTEAVKTEDLLQVEETQETLGVEEDKNELEEASKDAKDGDEDMGVCSAYDSGSTAVVGSFGKKEAEQDGTRTADEGSKDRIEEETKDTKAVEEDLTEKKEKEGRDASSIGEKQQEQSLDMGHGENKLETEMLDSTQDIQKPVTNSNEIKDENEGTKVNETDEKIEEISKTLVDENGEQKDISKDDLKFIDDKGEVIQDGIGQQLKSDEDKQKDHTADSNVKEMELSERKINMHDAEKGQDAGIHEEDGGQGDIINQNINKEQIELDEQKLNKFEQLASGMMSILATPSLSESSTLMPSSVVEQETDLNEAGTESATEAMKETLSTHTYSPVAVSQTLTEQKANPVSQEAEASEPVQEGDRKGGIVIDGTTFDAGDFGDETTSYTVQATQRIEPTSSMLENSFNTPAGVVKPTKLFDMPNDVEQTLLSPELQQNLQYDSHYPPGNQQTVQKDAGKPESIQATESNIKEPTGQEIEPSDKGNILQTSFGFATQSVEDTYTLPVDEVRVAVETEVVKNNETVSSDNVQDQVQPSLDQNAYKTDIFISRKPLSNEPAPAEKTAETNIQSQEAGTEDKQVNEEQTTPSGVTDENNNENNRKVDEDATNKGDWTVFVNEERVDESVTLPTTGSPEPYSSDEHVLSRQIPEPGLDEEMKQSEEVFMKTLESYMRTLINMLPPSLQTVLEQEPVGLSPTVTMLVSLISTNVLALLTCLGCVCKGKKKPVGRKDPLVVIRDLEEKLFIATKEKENLEDDLQVKSKKIIEVQQELNSQQSTTGTVETDLKTIQLHNEALKKQLLEAQEELEDYKQEVTEKSQVAAYKESELQKYQAEVQTLAQRAQDAELALQKTSQGLGEKEEELRVSLLQVQSQSEQIHQLETSKQQLQDEAVDWSEKMKELTEQTEQYSTDSKRMQEDLAFKENELEVLRDCFLQVKAFQGEEMREETDESPDLKEKLKQMMDVSRVNASLRSVEEERDVVQNKLLIEVESRKELEDQVQLLKRKFEGNQTDKMKAERQCQEAQTKLEVLSKYFKEKETELTRQLGEQEVLKNQNISRLQSSDSITVELTKENEVYRQQIEDLKTEISKAERDFRSQIAANEKKAHENWLATRAAERELKEARHECGMLRQKLTDLERKLMQGPPPGLIRPITHRAMPPPGMMNGPPPPPPPERPGSRGSVHGPVTPRLREDDYRASPIGPDRMPPPDRRHPPGLMGPRPPPPPLDAMSPPPYAIRPPFPPDRRSPPSFDRYPPPRGPRPPFPRPPPPHLRSPPLIGSIPSEHDDSRQDPVSPYNRAPQGSRDRGTTRHQSQV